MIKKIIPAILISAVLLCSLSAFAADVNLTDIAADHWAYSAIYQLVENGTVNGYPDGTFKPNGTVTYAEFEKMITGEWKNNPTPIDREAALEMLWAHSGSPEGYTVPGIISNQMANKNAVAWGYSTGLMQGNDGLNLRPADTLSRAEAATLIVRSKGELSGDHTFASSVDDAIAAEIWKAYGIFESPYSADEAVTAEELSGAAIKLGNFRSDSIKADAVTNEDAAVLLSYAAVSRSKMSVMVANDKATVATDKYGTLPQLYASYVHANGVKLPKDRNAAATKRDIALILLQLDDLIGKDGVKVNKNVASYPSGNDDFAYLQEGIAVQAYSYGFDNGAKAVDFYNFVSNYTFIFENFVNAMEGIHCGGKAELTMIPSMIAQNDETEAILRVKCTITGDTTAAELFGEGYENAGKEFYMELHTGEPVLNIVIPTDIAKIGKFVCNH